MQQRNFGKIKPKNQRQNQNIISNPYRQLDEEHSFSPRHNLNTSKNAKNKKKVVKTNANKRNYKKPWQKKEKNEQKKKSLKKKKQKNKKPEKFVDFYYPDGLGPDHELIKTIEGFILDQKKIISFKDITGLQNVKKMIESNIIIPFILPQFHQGIRKPSSSFLFYGPAGTGKTMMAKAIAYETKTKFFMINPSSIASKWRGESEKMVKLIF